MIQDFFDSIDKDRYLAFQTLDGKRGDFIVNEGTVCEKIFFVESGAVMVTLVDQSQTHIIRFGYSGSTVVMLDSFIHGKATIYNLEVLRKSKIRSYTKKQFFDFIGEDSQRWKEYSRLMESLVLQQMDREIDLLITSPQERYQRIIDRSPGLFQEIPLKYIAAYLRMSPETLSRLRNS